MTVGTVMVIMLSNIDRNAALMLAVQNCPFYTLPQIINERMLVIRIKSSRGMKMELGKRLFIIVVLLLAGCATASRATSANYEKILQAWMGASEDKLVSSWGAPVSTYKTDSGSKLLTFGGNRGAVFFNGMMIPVGCTTTFTITHSVVTNWRYQGNGCKAKDPDAY